MTKKLAKFQFFEEVKDEVRHRSELKSSFPGCLDPNSLGKNHSADISFRWGSLDKISRSVHANPELAAEICADGP